MANSVWQATIQNAAGDIVPGAEITVIDEGTGLNAVIYSSKAGAALTNPFNADAGGFAQFYSGPGEYRITAFDIGTGLTQTFDNWRLGDAGARDVGLNTGDVLSPEGAGLDGGETNYSTGNLNQLVFGGITGARFGQGISANSTTATFNIPLDLYGDISGAIIAGTFDIQNPLQFSYGVVGSANITFDGISSNGRCLCLTIDGLTGMVPKTPLTMVCISASSLITVIV